MIIKNADSLRGVFFIVKGQYSPDKKPAIEIDSNQVFVGCYNPESASTKEWYRVIDNRSFRCVYASSSLEGAFKTIRDFLWQFRTYGKYAQAFNDSISGKIPASEIILGKAVYAMYGKYYAENIRAIEEEVYEEISHDSLYRRSMNKVRKAAVKIPHIEVKAEKVVEKQEKVDKPLVAKKPKALPIRKFSL